MSVPARHLEAAHQSPPQRVPLVAAKPLPPKKRARPVAVSIALHAALILICVVTLYPVLWVVKMALTPSGRPRKARSRYTGWHRSISAPPWACSGL